LHLILDTKNISTRNYSEIRKVGLLKLHVFAARNTKDRKTNGQKDIRTERQAARNTERQKRQKDRKTERQKRQKRQNRQSRQKDRIDRIDNTESLINHLK
jgi:hypothetical protein